MSPLVTAADLALDGRAALASLILHPGEMVALVGPNGAGKTSLLRALAGVEGSAGRVVIDGEERDRASPARRLGLIGFSPASRDLAWPIATRDMIALSLPGPDPARVDHLLDAFELAPLADRPVDRLSTGERARVILARTLAPRPRLLLLDEPLANLDPYWVLRLQALVRDAVRETGAAALVAVHDLAQLARFDRVLVMEDGVVQMDETPARLMADERFLAIFRLETGPSGLAVRPSADRQSSP